MNGITAKVPDKQMAAVSAARAAVKQISALYARELAQNHICVNTINLGAIDTGRQRERYNLSKSKKTYREWGQSEADHRGIAFGRFGQPDEVAPMVLFLLSPLASYITNSDIDIAGGLGL